MSSLITSIVNHIRTLGYDDPSMARLHARRRPFVWWHWSRGGTSHLHVIHPRYQGQTWCGCLYRSHRGAGVDVYTVSDNAPVDAGLEVCEECAYRQAVKSEVLEAKG
jgi:hypothetical protein